MPRYQAGHYQGIQRFAAFRPDRCRGARSFGRRFGTVREEVCRFQVDWKDRRPIGAIFLAGPQINVPTNPRRWIIFGEIDVTNDKGKAAFRAALLKQADNSVQVLKDIGAQGMITWDPEGEEFGGEVYYGDPRLAPTLAPEMEFKNDGGKSVIDEYFEKFRAAGLKVGVCLRPQQITMVDGRPAHQAAEDEHAVQILRERIAYAKQRWGRTLFYVDSTATAFARSIRTFLKRSRMRIPMSY